MRTFHVLLLVTLLLAAGALGAEVTSPAVLRGDSGVLRDFHPTGVEFVGDELGWDLVLVVERTSNDLHLFDLRGRRFRHLPHPRDLSPARYAGLARLDEHHFLLVGSHYHRENNTRILYARSVVHRIGLEGEELTPDSARVNYSPDRALRKTHLYGQSVKQQLEIGGVAVDRKQRRAFFGLSRPLDEQGEVMILEADLDLLLSPREKRKKLEFRQVSTGLVPETDPTTGHPYYLSGMTYVPGRGLLVLLTSPAENPGGSPTPGANQLWLLRDGSGPAVRILDHLAPGARASGVAARPTERKGYYTVALVTDNHPRPAQLVLIRDVRL